MADRSIKFHRELLNIQLKFRIVSTFWRYGTRDADSSISVSSLHVQVYLTEYLSSFNSRPPSRFSGCVQIPFDYLDP